MSPGDPAEVLEDPKRLETLVEIHRLDAAGERATTYRLGKRLGVATATAKSRADPLVEHGLVEERWEEVSERGADTRVYSVTGEGRRALREAAGNRLRELRERCGELEDLLAEMDEGTY